MSNDGMIQNLNLDFNVMQFQTIMETIQCMAPEGSPIVALALQRAEAANYVIAERSADGSRWEPFVDNWSHDRAKWARSEVASSASSNHRLADNDVRRRMWHNVSSKH
jgi:hypothetical protein